MDQAPLKITIVNSLDHGANESRARHFCEFISQYNPNVTILNSTQLFNKTAFNWRNITSFPIPMLLFRFFQILKDRLHLDFPSLYYFFYLILRGRILSTHLQKNPSVLTIFQYPEDIFAINYQSGYPVLYDAPTLFYPEVTERFNGFLVEFIKKTELKVYSQVEHVSFHWYTYFSQLHHQHVYPKNEIILNWGCQTPIQTATFSKKPKIVYLGILNSSWVNPELLIELSQHYSIDVYSYQIPDPAIYPQGSLNYCGYMENLGDLANYQFGLITLDHNPAHSQGFSAKHLDYLSYGLPVFCSSVRQDPLLSRATISFTPSNFESQLKKYSQKIYWQKKHLAALKIAKELPWPKTLEPLKKIIPRS